MDSQGFTHDFWECGHITDMDGNIVSENGNFVAIGAYRDEVRRRQRDVCMSCFFEKLRYRIHEIKALHSTCNRTHGLIFAGIRMNFLINWVRRRVHPEFLHLHGDMVLTHSYYPDEANTLMRATHALEKSVFERAEVEWRALKLSLELYHDPHGGGSPQVVEDQHVIEELSKLNDVAKKWLVKYEVNETEVESIRLLREELDETILEVRNSRNRELSLTMDLYANEREMYRLLREYENAIEKHRKELASQS